MLSSREIDRPPHPTTFSSHKSNCLGSQLPLPAPPRKQTQHAEAGGEQWESARQRCRRGVNGSRPP